MKIIIALIREAIIEFFPESRLAKHLGKLPPYSRYAKFTSNEGRPLKTKVARALPLHTRQFRRQVVKAARKKYSA